MRARAHVTNRHATWLELFFDLVVVVVIAQAAHGIKDHPTMTEIIKNIALFLPVWMIWAGHTVYATRFDTDDVFYRVLTFGQMFAVAVIAVEFHHLGAGHSSVYAAAYVAARLLLLILLLRVHLHLPDMRKATRLYLTGFGIDVLFWLASFAVPAPGRFVLWGIGFSVSMITPWIGWWRKWLAAIPVDATHIPERFGLLNIIVLGEAVVGLVGGLSEIYWTIGVLLTAALGFLSAVVIWWTYFTYLEEVSERISIGSGQPYMYSHIPFILGVAGVGIGLEKLIASAHEPVASSSGVWIYCGGAILWALAFYAIQRASIPDVGTRRLNWHYLWSPLAFMAVAWFGVAWPSLIAQSVITGIFLCLLVLQSLRGREETDLPQDS
jgi:low temperature requirement protein LtrA